MNNINDFNEQLCSGCGSCIGTCPRKAIEYIKSDGFFKAEVNENICNGCGLCKKSCYRFNFIEGNLLEDSRIFCVQNKNGEVLSKSSSGGASNALMNALLDDGYIVYSFEYNNKYKNLFISKATSKREAVKFIGSKYMQGKAYDKNIFTELLNFPTNKKLAFFGTPCFISGIKLFLENKGFTNLFFVDLFCNGVPTTYLWQKYLESYGNVSSAFFRDKKYGWHIYSSSVVIDNKSKCKVNDKFYLLYFSNMFLNKSCYNCKIRTKFNSDIRIGDAWGYTFDTNKKGVSLVVCNTNKGNEIFNKTSNNFFFLKPISLNELKQHQSIFQKKEIDFKKREYLFSSLNCSFDSCYNSYIKSLPQKKRIVLSGKHIFNLFPYFFKRSLIKLFHKTTKRK